jgi:TIR domain
MFGEVYKSMKVFISWSGKRSNYVAKTLYEWIPRVIQNVEPWLSEEIPKGVRWSPEIAKALDETKFGVFCVTPENQGEPWLNFEAGALSKTVTERTYVCAYLIELRPIDVIGPLKEFQLTNSDKQDTERLMKTMNKAQVDRALSDKAFEDSFSVWWPRLEEKLKQLPPPEKPVPGSRNPESIQDEILELVRKIDQRLNTAAPELPSGIAGIPSILPSSISLATGSGKSYVIAEYLKQQELEELKDRRRTGAMVDKKKKKE